MQILKYTNMKQTNYANHVKKLRGLCANGFQYRRRMNKNNPNKIPYK